MDYAIPAPMTKLLVAIAVLLSAPARADTLFSAGLGGFVEPMRWKGPGELDPSELRFSTTAYGGLIPLRLTVTQDQREAPAFGVTIGLTPRFGGAKMGQSTTSMQVMIDLLARVTVLRRSAWSLQVGAGAALEKFAYGTNGVLSNDNVDPFSTTLYGGVVAASVTYFDSHHDYTFDLRAGLLGSEHMRVFPVLLTASMEWGRNR